MYQIFTEVFGIVPRMSAVDRGLIGNIAVYIYYIISRRVVQVGSATVFSKTDEEGNVLTEPSRTLHGHALENDEGCDNIVVRSVVIVQEFRKERYPYTFRTTDDVPQTLGDINATGFYVWNWQAMKQVSLKSAAGSSSKTKTANKRTGGVEVI